LQLAGRAFDENRIKDCLSLLKIIGDLDPNNDNAQSLRSRIRADIDRELHQVGVLLPRLSRDPRLFNTAHLAVERILGVEPDNEEAKHLLGRLDSAFAAGRAQVQNRVLMTDFSQADGEEDSELEGGRRTLQIGIVVTILLLALLISAHYAGGLNLTAWQRIRSNFIGASAPPAQPQRVDSSGSVEGILEVTVDDGVEVFVNGQYAGTAPVAPSTIRPGIYELTYKFKQNQLAQEKVTVTAGEVSRNSMHTFLGNLEFFVFPSSNAAIQVDDKASIPVPTHMSVRPGKYRLKFTSEGYEAQTVDVPLAAGERRTVTAILKPSLPAVPGGKASITKNAPQNSTPASDSKPTSAGIPKGTLAVGSRLPVDIFIDDRQVGTTPVSLELPAGTYNLEYRYGNLRQRATSVIKEGEVTRSTVVFEATVQVDSAPQADVFIDGIQGKNLGRTPLTEVRVPIGSTLVFRRAGAPEKRHTVTEQDMQINIVFP
jgi:hypothetical protein